MGTIRVNLSADVYMVCLSHALSTEKEEVMGLLIGEIDETRVAHISAVIVLRRSDKRKDRVEISPEQLSDASTQAEIQALAALQCKPMRVLGWYHSHPHITVWPSHVDVQTQAIYQMMDEGFVGLIFSVFSEDSTTKLNQVQVTCFQSVNQGSDGERYVRAEIPLYIVPSTHISNACLEALVQLPQILCQEEEDMFGFTKQVPRLDLLTKMHNGAVFVKALCNIAESVSGPLLQSFENRLRQNQDRIERLRLEKEELLQKIALAQSRACSTTPRVPPS